MILSALLPVTPIASAASVTLYSSKDAMIFANSSGVDTGNASVDGPALFAGADGSGNIKRSLIDFDVSAIPTNAMITSATVTLTLAQVAGGGGGSGGGSTQKTNNIGLHALNQAWTTSAKDGTGTATSANGTGQGTAPTNGDVTWTYATYNTNAASAVAWNNGTQNIGGGNFASIASATDSITGSPAVGTTFNWTSATLIADVQSWVNGTTANNGWLLRSDNLEATPTSFLGFWSRDAANAKGQTSLAPTLTVTYIPEPASMAALFLGASLFLRRTGRR